MFRIRAAVVADAPALRAVFRAASLGNEGDRAVLLAHPEALEWDASLIERAVVVVAEEASRVVGFATALPGPAQWEVEDLFVAPEHQRRGAASSLIEELSRRAREGGAQELVVTGNPHAARFYASAGFVETGVVETTFGSAPRLTRELAPLGDSHNFGRRVRVREGRIEKPRSVAWEHLVLGTDSPLRALLDEAAAREDLGPDAFAFLPRLSFSPSVEGPGGEVERVRLDPLPYLSTEETGALAHIVGRSLALFTWLGVADLHWENLVLGRDSRGQTIFAPLDVEMILADLGSPTETKLLPDPDEEYEEICRHACGVRRVLPYLGKPVSAPLVVAIAAAYLQTLAFLDRHAAEIADVFAHLPHLADTPIRVCLRGTDEYVRAAAMARNRHDSGGAAAAGRSGHDTAPEPLWPPLLDAEEEQLARGDIPYFFRLYGKKGIHYYADRSLTKLARLPMKGDVPQLEPLLSIEKGLRAPSRKRLSEEGLFTVLGAFDHPALQGRHEALGLSVAFQRRTLVVTLPDGEELTSRRDLRAFVGSVYLPCRCGEVRDVFVPATTTCEPAT